MTENELTSVVYELKGKFESVEKAVSAMDKKLDKLPCLSHEMRIEQLDKCLAENKTEHSETGRNRTAIIVALISLAGVIILAIIELAKVRI
jgi:hypothetical protein